MKPDISPSFGSTHNNRPNNSQKLVRHRHIVYCNAIKFITKHRDGGRGAGQRINIVGDINRIPTNDPGPPRLDNKIRQNNTHCCWKTSGATLYSINMMALSILEKGFIIFSKFKRPLVANEISFGQRITFWTNQFEIDYHEHRAYPLILFLYISLQVLLEVGKLNRHRPTQYLRMYSYYTTRVKKTNSSNN